MRSKLSDKEFEAVSTLIAMMKLDSVFDITVQNNEDCFYDFEEGKYMSLNEGFELLYDALTFPVPKKSFTLEEGELLTNLFVEFECCYEGVIEPRDFAH